MIKQEELELSILKLFLLDNSYAVSQNVEDMLAQVKVIERSYTGHGFFTTISILDVVFKREHIHWGDGIIGKVNNNTDIGFLMIPEGDQLTIEGFAFGDDQFPALVESFVISRQ